MKKRTCLIIIICAVLLIMAIVVFLKIRTKPTISYDKAMLTDYQNSFETAAKTCIEYHKEDDNADDFWLFCVDANADGLICYNEDEQQYYSLTTEQQQAFITVKSVFRLDHNGLSYLYVNDNFVSFGILNGRASFVYSASNEKPDFVNSPNEEENKIFVEKITDNWYYTCKQS